MGAGQLLLAWPGARSKINELKQFFFLVLDVLPMTTVRRFLFFAVLARKPENGPPAGHTIVTAVL